ncbi:GNAT family N-acetyltransferase [Ketobacter sp.]|uniref:GNAT family N-acetyltransferase n=1 Tax=Ketobacter sp. TaxID=2083498 RepID=UPI000F0D624D|nr:GNAT family N-acetyltransferase [Ketobacter sp.]RLU00641.1 MAG: GNAT family N-acetyltransferase [Ketobacter sp.]
MSPKAPYQEPHNIETLLVDYHDPQQARHLVQLLDHYARDPMGGGEPLADAVQANLVTGLAQRPFAFSLMCYVNGQPAALTNCFEGFSTFAAKPLINVHDIVVHRDYRGLGLSQILLNKVETLARERGCCKITLEVLSGNTTAQGAYRKFGFEQYQLDPNAGQAQFWQKPLH